MCIDPVARSRIGRTCRSLSYNNGPLESLKVIHRSPNAPQALRRQKMLSLMPEMPTRFPAIFIAHTSTIC